MRCGWGEAGVEEVKMSCNGGAGGSRGAAEVRRFPKNRLGHGSMVTGIITSLIKPLLQIPLLKERKNLS